MPQNEEFLSKGLEEEQSKIADILSKSLGKSANDVNLEAQKNTQLKTPDPKKIKELRMFVDHLILQTKGLSPTRELSLAYTNMQRGFMWLGMVLADINEPNPYLESTNISSSKIEERTDQAKDSSSTFGDVPILDRTASVKWFRLYLDNVLNRIDFGFENHHCQLAKDAFKEAKMWFGEELNNIRLSNLK